MGTVLTGSAFGRLLSSFDPEDETRAGEKYELLRLKLIKCLCWSKGCPESESDSLADTVLDRLASKIEQGEQVKNMNAYARSILEFVWKEHGRRNREYSPGEEKMPEVVFELDESELLNEADLRTRCLRKCIAEIVPDDNERALIIGYYDVEAGDKLKDIRKALAGRLGLSANTLKVKAFRLRERLERCINECVSRMSVTKTPAAVATN